MADLSFKRIEKKYAISDSQKEILLKCFCEKLKLDKFCADKGYYSLKNIYVDDDNNFLIRTSISKPTYKQKIRVRKYEGQKSNYLEIKKKCDGIVGKRRVELTDSEIDDFFYKKIIPKKEKFLDQNVLDEIAGVVLTNNIRPYALLSYDRISFKSKDNSDLRITLDFNIKCNETKDFVWKHSEKAIPLLKEGYCLLEIKNTQNYPLWLANLLSCNKIYPVSFSKIGTFYKLNIKEKTRQ